MQLAKKEEFSVYITGHLYDACPILIPTLPTPSPDLEEEDLMKSLGMKKDKDGNFETFDRFISRTEVSLNCNNFLTMECHYALSWGNDGKGYSISLHLK